jgi:glycosyltransferase involved in cell wall biosynthesis
MRLLYRSELARTGYGLAALAYVRHLKLLGARLNIRVKWAPFFVNAARTSVAPPSSFNSELVKFARLVANDEAWRDLPDLLFDDGLFGDPDVTVLHCMPQWWASLRSDHGKHMGYLAWETDTWPKAWLPHAKEVDALMVPSLFNAQAVLQAPGWTGMPVHVVPHVCRPLAVKAHQVLPAIKQHLRLPEGMKVFYAISDWIPRKNLVGLIRAFCQAFDANEPVALVIKTLPTGQGVSHRSYQATQVLFEEVLRSIPRRNPHVFLWPSELDTQEADALHVLGDVFISLSHGEGWGMGAFEAASFGNPVIAPAWSGWVDYLGTDWPGSVAYETASLPSWAGQDIFTADQQWCVPDEASAVKVMRAFVQHPAPFLTHAKQLQQSLQLRFDPLRVTQAMLTHFPSAKGAQHASSTYPLVSCLLVAKGSLRATCNAISDFLSQTWLYKELIVLTDHPRSELQTWLQAQGAEHVTCIYSPPGDQTSQNLGARYNQAMAVATGEYVAIWDEAARHAPSWLTGCVSALTAHNADVIWLNNTWLWRPEQMRLVRLGGAPWMPSMVAKRDGLPAFADQADFHNDPMRSLLIDRGRAISVSDSKRYVNIDDASMAETQANWSALERAHAQLYHEGMDGQLAIGRLHTELNLMDGAQWLEHICEPRARQMVTCQRLAPGQPQASAFRLPTSDLLQIPASGAALVSCLMVTRGDLSRARFAVMSFLQQTWPNKELVVVTQDEDSSLAAWLATLDDPSIHVHLAASSLLLGDLRNISVARAQGEFVMQWDDDDLSDPDRITAFMGVIQRLNVDLVFLSGWFQWWPARRSFCNSKQRAWEGSMLARKSCMVAYPGLSKGEDTDVMQALVSRHTLALVDWPELYVYTVTGNNTWDASHFERHWKQATWTAQGHLYDDMMAALNHRVPIKAYEEALKAPDAPPKWTRVVQYTSSWLQGDGVSQSISFMDALLKEAGFDTDIYLGCLSHPSDGIPRNNKGEPLALTGNDNTLLLVHFPLGDAYLAHLMQMYKGPVAMYFHNMTPTALMPSPTHNPLLHQLHELGTRQLRAFKDRYCMVMAASRYSAKELVRSYQYNDVDVLPALVDTDQWEADLAGPGQAVAALENVPYVLQVSRLMPHKNQLASVAALHALRTQYGHDMHLVLVGDTSEAQYVQALREDIQSQGLAPFVHVLGKIEHDTLTWLYQHAKAYLCMSTHEGFGMPLLEALVAGCPIVALDTSAKHEVVYGHGHLVPPLPADNQVERVAAALHDACIKSRETDRLAAIRPYKREALVAQLMAILQSARHPTT